MYQRLSKRVNTAREDGFTLIELLIVIVILGILAGIVVFAVGTARDDADKNACKADKKTISVALEAYKAKNAAYPAAQTASSNSALVPNYIKSWPTSDKYAISTTSDGGVTIAAGTAGGPPAGCST